MQNLEATLQWLSELQNIELLRCYEATRIKTKRTHSVDIFVFIVLNVVYASCRD